ncbi:sialate O-acetylesterase [Dyadobacter aurulentus]|uniref:sialate O-acetylesterase n=1 Tax=Dyadobacter sp. UC 10 TaxID=2605428 RepID=UPI0011F3FE71|nr:sialate O-acetylesterase [Dyadobacter sp. UC 10]KAA0992480.1 sialate O-acetylesterase [Dyadobacter sp. UC 10]
MIESILARLFTISFFALCALTAAAQSVPEKLDLYLLIGQSNMAGRGKADGEPGADSSGIWVLNKQNVWQPAADPLHFDKPTVTGVGPGLSFAKEVLKGNPGKPIGLIPCAVGGSGIDDWQTGVKHEQTGIYAYDEMIRRVKEAKKTGRIKGILWHQGESDSSPGKNIVYEQKLEAFFKKLRKETGTRKVPLLVGTLGDFYVASKPGGAKINETITRYAGSHRHVYLVSSGGLTDQGDKTHFDARSARELGKRYAEAFLRRREK